MAKREYELRVPMTPSLLDPIEKFAATDCGHCTNVHVALGTRDGALVVDLKNGRMAPMAVLGCAVAVEIGLALEDAEAYAKRILELVAMIRARSVAAKAVAAEALKP